MKDFLRLAWYWMCRYPLSILPHNIFFNVQSMMTDLRKGHRPRLLNVKNPRTFNEKIMYLKIHPVIKNGEMLADKYRVRDFIAEKIGEQYLVPLFGVYDKVEDIDFNSLPEKFVLKSNHGSGWNIVCKNKQEINWKKACKKMEYWLTHTQYYVSREWQYRHCPRKIIGEQFLEYNITDYKFFCFNGEPRYIQIDTGRFTNHHRAIMSTQWELMPFALGYAIPQEIPQRPQQLEEMIRLAKILSEGTNFVRVDFYIHDNKVYFGEITLHPNGGCDYFSPNEYDKILGDMISLT